MHFVLRIMLRGDLGYNFYKFLYFFSLSHKIKLHYMTTAYSVYSISIFWFPLWRMCPVDSHMLREITKFLTNKTKQNLKTQRIQVSNNSCLYIIFWKAMKNIFCYNKIKWCYKWRSLVSGDLMIFPWLINMHKSETFD